MSLAYWLITTINAACSSINIYCQHKKYQSDWLRKVDTCHILTWVCLTLKSFSHWKAYKSSGPILESKIMLATFQKRAKNVKKRQNIWNFGQKCTKFKNVLKKGRWFRAIIANKLLQNFLVIVIPNIALFKRLALHCLK